MVRRRAEWRWGATQESVGGRGEGEVDGIVAVGGRGWLVSGLRDVAYGLRSEKERVGGIAW